MDMVTSDDWGHIPVHYQSFMEGCSEELAEIHLLHRQIDNAIDLEHDYNLQ